MMEKMNLGPDLDALIAEKVMGLEPWPGQDPRCLTKTFKARFVPHGQDPKPCAPPEYSTDIAAAWEVVEHMKSKGFYLSLRFDTAWLASFEENGSVSGDADNVPEAICQAALCTLDIE